MDNTARALSQAPVIALLSSLLSIHEMSRLARVSSVIYRAWICRCSELKSVVKISHLRRKPCFPVVLCSTYLPKCVEFAAYLCCKKEDSSFASRAIFMSCLTELGSGGHLNLACQFTNFCKSNKGLRRDDLIDGFHCVLDGYSESLCESASLEDVKKFSKTMANGDPIGIDECDAYVSSLIALAISRGLSTFRIIFFSVMATITPGSRFANDFIRSTIVSIFHAFPNVDETTCDLLISFYRSHHPGNYKNLLYFLKVIPNRIYATISKEESMELVRDLDDSNSWKKPLLKYFDQ